MRVLISGAGPAGLTLAYWLQLAGHTPTIVEKSPTIRTAGYMIDFAGTGWDVANRMGIIPMIRERAYPIESILYKDANDHVASQISMKELLDSMGDTSKYAALNRRVLVRTLYEAVQDKVEICFDKYIESLAQDDSKVTVTFHDGSTADYDILVACDGIHSHVRQLIFGDESQFTHHLGYQFAIFEVPPLKHDLGNSYQMYVEPNFQVGIYPTEPDKWLIFVIFKHADTHIPPQSERVAALKDYLQHWKWYVPEILDALDEGDYVFWDNLTQIQMTQWYKNRVGVIGDAAYCPTLLSGQGASMAMAGAYFLADALKQTNNPQTAFERLDQRLHAHINKIQRSAENFAPTFIPKNRLRMALVNWVLRLSGIPLFKGVIGKQFTVNSILD